MAKRRELPRPKVPIEREPEIIDIAPQEEIFSDVNIQGKNPVAVDRARLRIAAREKSRVNSAAYASTLFPNPNTVDTAGISRAATKLSRSKIEADKRFNEAKFRLASWSSRLSKDVTLYPSIATAMAQDASLSEADVKLMVNFTSAWAATDAFFSASTEQSQWNILLSLPDNQRAIVSDIITARMNQLTEQYEAKLTAEKDEVATYGAPRKIATAGLDTAGLNVKNIVKTWEAGVEFASHVVRANIAGGNDPFGLFKSWDETNIDRYNEEVLDEAREEYGNTVVDLVVEMRNLKLDGDPSPLSTMQTKYVGDPERMPILNNLIHRAFDDPERIAQQEKILKIAEIVNSASTGDLGQMVTTINPFTGKAIGTNIDGFRGSSMQQLLAGTTNIAATFALDPIVIGSVARKTYLGARYGLERVAVDAGVDVTTKALNRSAVFAYLNRMGKDIVALNKAADEGKDVTVMSQKLSSDYAKYFPEDVIQDFRKAKITSADDVVQYVNDSNAAIRIARGDAILADDMEEVIRLEQSSIFGRMIGEQTGRRSKPLLPRENVLTNGVPSRIISLVVSKATPRGVGKDEVQRFYKDVNDPNMTTGDILIEKATLIGAADRGRSIGYMWDKTGRLISTTPAKMIYTADARDTKTFYKYARMHVSGYQAKWLAEEWRTAPTQAERIKMWIGIVRTSAASRGFDDINKMEITHNGRKITVGDLAEEIDVSRRSGVMYSPSSITITNNGIETTLEDFINSNVNDLISNSDLIQLDQAYRKSPSNFDGKQHPLHLWQTSDYLAVPNMNELQRLTKRNAVLMATQGNSLLNDQATNLVSWWSLLNLAGPRYSMRNSIEDYVLYAFTGGYFMDIIKGRAFSVGQREARGRNIGIVARNTTRKVGDALDNVEDGTGFWNRIVLPNLDESEVAAARAAVNNGDMTVLRDLSVTAVLRTKLGKTYTAKDKEYLADFVSSNASFSTLDEVAETATYGNMGLFPPEGLSKRLNGVSLGGEMIGFSKNPVKNKNYFTVYPKGAYSDVAMHGDNFARWSYWQESISKTILSDGTIGKVAVMYLDDTEKAVAAVVNAIKTDTKYRYKAKLVSASGADVDEFARRYVQDVLNTFSDQNGLLNKALWKRFIDIDDAGNRSVEYWVKGEKNVPRVSIQEFIEYPENQLPRNILGKSVDESPITIPIQVSNKIFQAMGEAVARISKEPIFFANYLASRRQLSTYQKALAEATNEVVAKDLASRHALNRAMEVSLSYTDNPRNRTIAAWRMRNWARYYRAQEDFYRRLYRMAKYEPVGFYKGYLAVGALEDVGVLNEDEFGNKYFIYPGDNIVNNVLGQLLSGNGDRLYLGATPLMLTGNLTMVAPSFDPKAMIPQLQGPLSSFLVKSVISFVPQFAKYEKFATGEYSVGKPLWQSMFPAPIAKLFNSLNQDERDSSYASAVMGATRVLEGAGMLPKPGQVSDSVKGTIGWDQAQKAIGDLAITILTTRLMLGFIYPASPQIEENDVTMLARKYGIPNMRSNYIEMAKKYIEAGDPDPWGRALMEGVEIFGLSYTPYKTSKTASENILKSVPEVSRAAETLDFVKDNKALVAKYGASSMFVAPISSGYSVEAVDWLEKNDYLSSSSIKDFALSVSWSSADYEYSQAMDDYYRQLGNARTDSHRRAIEEKKDEKIQSIYVDYGLAYKDWKSGYSPNGAEQIISPEKNVDSVRGMVDDYYKGTFGEKVPESIEYISQALSTYDYFLPSMKAIEGQTNAAKSKRAEIKGALLNNLKIVASKNVNAEMFIRRVLYRILKADSEGNIR